MKKRILILDDDPDILEILQVILSEEGFEAILVESTDDLLDLVRLHRPCLILLDFGLRGGITGGEWCVKLKSDMEFSRIPVIIFTAYSNKGIAAGTFGCDDFLPKPFDIEDLVARVRFLTLNNFDNKVLKPYEPNFLL